VVEFVVMFPDSDSGDVVPVGAGVVVTEGTASCTISWLTAPMVRPGFGGLGFRVLHDELAHSTDGQAWFLDFDTTVP
jgi:hypothetical protein